MSAHAPSLAVLLQEDAWSISFTFSAGVAMSIASDMPVHQDIMYLQDAAVLAMVLWQVGSQGLAALTGSNSLFTGK